MYNNVKDVLMVVVDSIYVTHAPPQGGVFELTPFFFGFYIRLILRDYVSGTLVKTGLR